MKSTRLATLCVALSLAVSLNSNSHATIYSDPSNDLFDNGFSNLDITSVEVTNTATAITIAVTVRGFQDWTKYLIGIRTAAASVSSTTGNAWGRNGTYSEGINFQIASWVDGGGGVQFVRYTGGAWDWSSTSGATIDMTQSGSNKISWTVSLASLGLGTGDTFKLDVGTTGGGGGDPFVDMASRSDPSTSGWGVASTGGPMLSYTVEAILDFDGDGFADATDTDDDNDGLLDAVETNSGIWVSSSDTGTNPKNVDTDGDGLNDGVETNTGAYVDVTNTGSNPVVPDDFDRDLFPDFYDTDDDNDTLADTVENGSGNWVSSSNTGTNSKDDDTDNDGLKDGVETNTGSYASATDTGTNPHLADQALVILVGNNVLFPTGSWEAENTNNRLLPAVGGPYNIKSITRFIASPTNNIEFKFTGGNWDLNWGIGSNGVTVLNTNTGAISGTLFKDKTPTADDRTINVNIGRARGEYVFTFNDATNSLEFSVTRKSYSTLADYVVGYNLTGANAEATADQDGDTLDNQAEFTANTAPDSMDTDGDGVNDNDELGATYGFATNPTLPDSDGDGLRDLWELTNNLNPLVATGNDGANGDPDNDGSPNILEQANGTDPNAAETGFSSPYAKITIPGSFTGWNVDGNWENTMKLVGNNSWRALIFVSTNTMAATNQFKFAPGSYTGSWGRGPSANVAVQNASENLLTTVLNTNGYYRFDFNDFSGAFSITAVSGGTDANTNGLPDAYEAWYGGQLTPAVTTLDPAGDPDGDGVTTADEFAAGSNPVFDVAAPGITLVGDETLVLAQNGTYVDPGVTVTDDRTNAVSVTTNTSQLNPALKGVYPVTYVATDAAGNSTTNNQRFVVVGDWIDGYPSPIFYNLQIIGSGGTWNRNVTNNQAQGTFEVYAQYYRRGSTEGTNKTDAKASCWIGVTTNTNASATNDLTTSDWTWTPANLNAGNNGGNDEYGVTYTNLAPGTYQVVSRWQFDGGVYGYGGLNEDNQGGALGRTVPKVVGTGTNAVTNQIAYLPGSITVTPVSVGYANVQWPPTATIDTAGSFTIYAQVYSAGVTDASTNAPTYAGFKAQIGTSTGNNDPTTAPNLFNWTDVTATGWNGANGNNDEYTLILSGASLGAGTYYYASRFSVDGGATWVYGGIKADGTGGGNWDSTNANGVLTVNKVTPTITAAPTASAITAGQALSASTLSGGTASVAGTFGWTTSTTVPTASGNYSVTFTPTDTALYNTATVDVSVTVNPAGTTFAGWAGGATLDATNVGKYAIGGASSLTATDGVKPTSTVSGGNLVLTAIVRTDDPKLAVVGEVVTSLANYASGTSVTEVTGSASGIDQTGVPAGCEKQAFTVPQGADTKKFLRLKATLQP